MAIYIMMLCKELSISKALRLQETVEVLNGCGANSEYLAFGRS